MFPALPVPLDALPLAALREMRAQVDAALAAPRRTGRPRAPITCAMLEQARDAGWSTRHAAREWGTSPMAVARAIRREGVAWPSQREAMRRLHADPEFAARNAERMRRLHADPEFAARHAARHAERMRRLNADPARNPLAALTPEERADYDVLRRKGGLTRDEALRAIGRGDLIRAST